jgi:hypothetical protein
MNYERGRTSGRKSTAAAVAASLSLHTHLFANSPQTERIKSRARAAPAKAAEMKKKRTRIFHKWLCVLRAYKRLLSAERERECDPTASVCAGPGFITK